MPHLRFPARENDVSAPGPWVLLIRMGARQILLHRRRGFAPHEREACYPGWHRERRPRRVAPRHAVVLLSTTAGQTLSGYDIDQPAPRSRHNGRLQGPGLPVGHHLQEAVPEPPTLVLAAQLRRTRGGGLNEVEFGGQCK
ncbi:hypothetical protein BV20DRAFT_153968 [Pilatotrama ljubarskyi]|nr:hypothetical protein BV20DRAFT_153968 [Pilatotrama ljubarskyi]